MSTLTTTTAAAATILATPPPDPNVKTVNVVDLAIPLAGGELISGIVFVLTLQMLYKYGAGIGLFNDKKRQILLNLICFVVSINTMISYGYNMTGESVLVSNITTIITFLSVQYGLVILNHNTIIRMGSAFFPIYMSKNRQTVDKACLLLYLLPWLVFFPIYYAIDETWSNAATWGKVPLAKPFNTSSHNANFYKPLNIALIITTEMLAIVTDLMLLYKAYGSRRRLTMASKPLPAKQADHRRSTTNNNGTTHGTQETANSEASSFLSDDILANYAITWFLIIFDIAIKILIYQGKKFLFDSIISIATIAMRSRANLNFGLELQSIFRGGAGKQKSDASKAVIERQKSVDMKSMDELASKP